MSSSLISIKSSEDTLQIINQLLLPHSKEFISIQTVEDAHDAIKSMKIRGAPAIASLAALSVAQHLTRALKESPPPQFLSSPTEFSEHVQQTLEFLYTARPTAVNLGEATSRLSACMKNAFLNTQDTTVAALELIKVAKAVADEDVGRNKEMAKHAGEWLIERVRAQRGEEFIRKGLNVLTVCNTGSLATSGYGTALGMITYLHETGKLDKAYYTQTAPYHQGSRLTALELQTLGVPSVMICDTMVGSLFQHYDIHAVVVGADRIAKNGDTANKIGTYNASVIAARHNIPVIVVAPVTTVDLATENGTQIPIEQRPAIEACLVRGIPYPPTSAAAGSDIAVSPAQVQVMITPPGLQGIYNPSFDVTPAELISAIVTEKGVAVKKEAANEFDLVGSGVV